MRRKIAERHLKKDANDYATDLERLARHASAEDIATQTEPARDGINLRSQEREHDLVIGCTAKFDHLGRCHIHLQDVAVLRSLVAGPSVQGNCFFGLTTLGKPGDKRADV